MGPTCRSLNLLRKAGWQVAVVEKWLPKINLRKDAFGFADVLAAHPVEKKILLVQVTTIGHLANRLAKVRSRPEARIWLESGGLVELHGWGLRNGRWHCKRVAVQADTLDPIIVAEAPRQRRRSRWQQGDLF